MLSVTSGYKTANKSNVVRSNGKISVYDTVALTTKEFDNAKVGLIEITGTTFRDGRIIGNLSMHDIKIEMFGDTSADFNLNSEKHITPSFGMLVGASYEWLAYQKFIVSSVEYDDTTRMTTIRGADFLWKSNVDFVDTNTYPMSLLAYLVSVGTYCGLSIENLSIVNGSFSIESKPFPDFTPCSYIFSRIAELGGYFVRIKKSNNKLELINAFPSIAIPSETLTKDNYFQMWVKEHNFGANGINTLVMKISQVEGENNAVENATNVGIDGAIEVQVVDNDIVNTETKRLAVINNLFTVVDGFKFVPSIVDYIGYPYLEVGDTVQVTKMDNYTFVTVITDIMISYDGGMKGQIRGQTLNKTQTTYRNFSREEKRIRNTEIQVDKVANEISLIASDISDLGDVVNGTVANSAGLTLTPSAITTSVRSSTEYTTDLGTKENNIIKQTTAPTHLSGRLWLNTSVTPNILYRSTGSAWVKVTPTEASEVGAYSTGQVDTKLIDYSTIIQTASQIALEVGTVKGGQDSIVPYIQGSWEQGALSSTGTNVVSSTYIRTKNLLPILPSTDYIMDVSSLLWDANSQMCFYNSSGVFIERINFNPRGKRITTHSTSAFYRIHLNKLDNSSFPLSDMPNHFVRVVPVGKYLKGSKFEINGEKIISTADGIEFRNASGTPMIYFDTVSGKYKFNGEIVATSGKIGRFDISGDDLVYTSDLFNREYDYSDIVKLRNILAGIDTPTAYESEVYDVNNTGELSITDLVLINLYVTEGDPLPTPRRQIRSIIRIGTTSGELKTTAVSALGNTGSTFSMKADKLTGDFLNVKTFGAKGGNIDLLDVINGVRFPATFVGSNDVNVLDDYEEGTWTPTIFGVTSAGTATYTLQDGKYTKIGNVVHFNARLTWTGHTGTGAMALSLPFTNGSTFATCSIGFSNITFTNIPTALIGANENRVVFYTFGSGGALSSLAVDSAGTVYVSGSYMV